MLGICLLVWCLGQNAPPAERITFTNDIRDHSRTERVIAYEYRWMVVGAIDQTTTSNAVFAGGLPVNIQFLKGRVALAGGAIVASTTVPRGGTHANFMARVEVRLTDRIGITYWHWSNGNLGDRNPSVDSAGVTLRLRRH